MKRRRSAPRPRRRGVILIVVVGLMALFALVGVTFVITAEQANRGAQNAAEVERYEDPPETLLNRAFQQVLVGTKNRFSSIGPNSLLEDMYGPGRTLVIPAGGFAPNDAGYSLGVNGAGGMMYITGLPTDDPSTPAVQEGLMRLPSYYIGHVITMLTGPAAGKSARITGYTINSNLGILRLTPFPGMTLATSGNGWNEAGAPRVGDRFLINSRPFNGTGAGFDPIGTTTNTATDGLLDYPLQFAGMSPPNILAAMAINARDPDVARYIAEASASGDMGFLHLDEDYDAADYQNPHLALYSTGSSAGPRVISPSYHRPEILRYYAQQLLGSPTPAALDRRILRKLTPRPLVQDHPALATLNPAFNPANAALFNGQGFTANDWDVDNDGDGRPDSVWIDVGFDVQTDAQGRKYKPLVAILCRDMDGKLNLNAHGQNNDFQYPTDTTNFNYQVHAYKGRAAHAQTGTPGLPVPGTVQDGGGGPTTTPAFVTLGSGLSPADVNLAAAFTAQSEFVWLLHGRVTASRAVPGRYGEAHLVTATDATMGYVSPLSLPRAGRSTTASANPGYDDNFPPPPYAGTGTNVPAPYWTAAMPHGNRDSVGNYGAPVDLDGNGAIIVGFDGSPLFFSYGYGVGNTDGSTPLPEYVDEAFEINLYNRSGYAFNNRLQEDDSPFTPEDLEWLLRPYDVNQPKSRLADLIPATASNVHRRSLLTTESWDVPTPSVQCTPEIRKGLFSLNLGARVQDPSFLDLVRGKLWFVRDSLGLTPNNLQAIDALIYDVTATSGIDLLGRNSLGKPNDVLAAELMLGTRVDVNRPLSNGYDDDGNGFVDESAEWATEKAWGYNFDRNGDGRINSDDAHAGQRLARHLYFLMMLLTDWNFIETASTGSVVNGMSGEAARRDLTARRIAQWAVNVVDFRDSDAIMTPFEYDVNPFNGWNVDGDVNTITDGGNERRVVWGCENPYLLITETTAVHDVRVKDLNQPDSMTNAPMNPDEDPDQTRMPQGSAFVELFCPASRTMMNPGGAGAFAPYFPPELFNGTSLDLGRVPPGSGPCGRQPVWRLAFSKTAYEPVSAGAGTQLANNDQNVNWRVTRAANSEADIASFEPQMLPLATAGTPQIQPSGAERFSQVHSSIPVTGAGGPVLLERVVWMTTEQPGTGMDNNFRDMIYYNRGTNNMSLEPGRYALIGPARSADLGRFKTRIGYSNSEAVQAIDLTASASITTAHAAGTDHYAAGIGTNIAPVLGIPCAWVEDFTSTTYPAGPVGFSLSEPRPSNSAGGAGTFEPTYYGGQPMTSLQQLATGYNDGFQPTDEFRPPNLLTEGDQPFDSKNNAPLSEIGMIPADSSLRAGLSLGTLPRFSTVFLQRLADPTQPYSDGSDGRLNPYITVDWSEVDLHVYNGEADKWSEHSTSTTNASNLQRFGTRQRGGLGSAKFDTMDPTDPQSAPGNGTYPKDADALTDTPSERYDLWFNTWSRVGTDITPFASTTTNPNVNLNHTLGYLNRTYQTNTPTLSANPFHYATNNFGDANLLGMPLKPFRWLPFNNRPFTSHLELMMVPASSNGRLGWEAVTCPATAPTAAQFYGERDVAKFRSRGAFGHLLNFFYSSETRSRADSQNSNAIDVANAASNYHRIFEYLHVPSRFSGSEQFLNPAVFNVNGTAVGTDNYSGSTFENTKFEFAPFYAPYNKLPTYREPGRVNFNTMNDEDRVSWHAVTNFFARFLDNETTEQTFTATWTELRRSFWGGTADPSAALGTRIKFPFRSYGTSNYVATPAMRQYAPATEALGISTTMLRPKPDGTGAGYEHEPFFRFTLDPTSGPVNGVHYDFNDPNQNAYYRFELMNKLANVTTPRSNVYAVWATIGFFEVERAIPNDASNPLGANVPALGDENYDGNVNADDFWTVYPDGYTYKGELGADTGEIKRHRGFWIVDRTIPVGFERGEVHNAMDAVILQRVLE